jgi:hypothetical protein
VGFFVAKSPSLWDIIWKELYETIHQGGGMEFVGIIGLIIGVLSVGFAGWQVRLAREQVRLARLQTALPSPSSNSYGLRASNLPFVDLLLGKYEASQGGSNVRKDHSQLCTTT